VFPASASVPARQADPRGWGTPRTGLKQLPVPWPDRYPSATVASQQIVPSNDRAGRRAPTRRSRSAETARKSSTFLPTSSKEEPLLDQLPGDDKTRGLRTVLNPSLTLVLRDKVTRTCTRSRVKALFSPRCSDHVLCQRQEASIDGPTSGTSRRAGVFRLVVKNLLAHQNYGPTAKSRPYDYFFGVLFAVSGPGNRLPLFDQAEKEGQLRNFQLRRRPSPQARAPADATRTAKKPNPDPRTRLFGPAKEARQVRPFCRPAGPLKKKLR